MSELNPSVFLASVCLVNPIGVCLKCFPTSFAKSIWRDHLMSSRINPISFLPVSVWWVWSVSVRAGSHRFFLPMSVRRNLLMSVWTELACFLASVFLVSSIGVCLKCFPLLVCQCLSSGATWFLSGFFLKSSIGVFLICCPAFLNSPVWRDWGLSANLYHLSVWMVHPVSAWVGTQVSPLFWGCQLVVFLWVFQDSVSRTIRSPSGLLAQSFLSRLYKFGNLQVKMLIDLG